MPCPCADRESWKILHFAVKLGSLGAELGRGTSVVRSVATSVVGIASLLGSPQRPARRLGEAQFDCEALGFRSPHYHASGFTCIQLHNLKLRAATHAAYAEHVGRRPQDVCFYSLSLRGTRMMSFSELADRSERCRLLGSRGALPLPGTSVLSPQAGSVLSFCSPPAVLGAEMFTPAHNMLSCCTSK